ncbi:hypothetical protein V2G26_004710 [Clonostachys chloroleuca]
MRPDRKCLLVCIPPIHALLDTDAHHNPSASIDDTRKVDTQIDTTHLAVADHGERDERFRLFGGRPRAHPGHVPSQAIHYRATLFLARPFFDASFLDMCCT